MLPKTDLQAKFLIPMAISLAFGILFATVITLIRAPCLHLILDDFINRIMRVNERRRATKQLPRIRSSKASL